jgi:hypothetical protein
MISIQQLIDMNVDKTITRANYTEGPNHFDQWYNLLKIKCPNIIRIDCSGNGLETLYCPDFIAMDLSCNNLKTIDCPNVSEMRCQQNQLVELICNRASIVICYDNQIKSLSCTSATILHCWDNQLTEINAPNAANIICYNNPNLRYIDAPVKNLRYDSDIGTTVSITNRPNIYHRFDINKLNY